MLPYSNGLSSVTIYSYSKMGINGGVSKGMFNIWWIGSDELSLDEVLNSEVSGDVVDDVVPMYLFLRCRNNSLYDLKGTL